MDFTLCFCIFLSALHSRNKAIFLSTKLLYNPPPQHSHHFYLWSWRQCVPPKHREISATATRHQNWGEKIHTGGKFWWKETLQLKPSLKTALILQHLTWVVFPDPVSPQTSTTWLLLIKLTMSSLISQMGKACLNGCNSWFTVACGTCGMPPFIRPTALFMSFTVKSKLQICVA